MIKYLPNALTLLNLGAGVAMILKGDVRFAFICIIVSLIADGLDGFLARKLNVDSPLGIQLDSLADLISFIVGPSYIYYVTFLESSNIISYLPIIFFCMMGCLRLGIFNVSEPTQDFIGLPTPSGGLIIIGVLLLGYLEPNNVLLNHYLLISTPIIIGLYMVSPLTLMSLKYVKNNKLKKTLFMSLGLVLLLLIVIKPAFAILITMLTYLVFSIIYQFQLNQN